MTSDTEGEMLDSAATVHGLVGGQRVVGRYRLEKVLGQGGMGIVWLAHDEQLDRDVALKFLPEMVVNDRASLKDLKKEMLRTLELTHPNIVRTYDFIQAPALAGISMEYVDGDTLRNLQVDQPHGVFQTAQLGEWTRQLCGALDYAHHNAGIVHRDLKPANLMVNGRSQIKIADFGIARSLVEATNIMTMRGGTSGTLVYMSPQQLSDDHGKSVADDIYAAGATLYDLLTSRPPFYAGDIAGQIREKVAPSVAERRASLGIPLGDVPENWERTIAACLAKDPSARPRSAGEIAVNLGLAEAASVTTRDVLLAPPSTVAPSTVPPAVVPPAPPADGGSTVTPFLAEPPRNRGIGVGAPALAVGLLILAAALVWWMQGGKPAEAPVPIAAAPVSSTPAPPPVAPAEGGLLINTDPAGAMVTVGDLPPKKSPAAFSEVPVGPQTVQVALEGYQPFTTTTIVAQGKINDLGSIPLAHKEQPAVTGNTNNLAPGPNTPSGETRLDLTASPAVASAPGGSSSAPGPATALNYNPSSAPDSGGDSSAGTAPPSGEQQQVNYDYFHDQLAPYGSWVNVNGTMYWHPDQALAANPDWRPYYDMGQWVQTDNGLFWRSDYTWGDIPFHYGRWVLDPNQGWLWAPDYTWGPAWVYWRDAAEDGDIGWAPLPIGALYVDGVLMYNGVVVGPDFDFGLGPDYWVFADYGHFHENIFRMRGHEWGYHIGWDRNRGLWGRSHVRDDFRKDDQGRFVNNGLGRERMDRITHGRVERSNFEERSPVGNRDKLAAERRAFHSQAGHEGGRSLSGGERSSIGGEKSALNGERLARNGRSSFGGERSSLGDRSAFGGDRSAFGGDRSAFGGDRSAFGGDRSFGGQRSSFGGDSVSKVFRPSGGGGFGASHASFRGGGGGGGRRR